MGAVLIGLPGVDWVVRRGEVVRSCNGLHGRGSIARMFLGYALILLAALGWGSSAIMAKYLANHNMADAVLLSQTRVTFSWIVLFLILIVSKPSLLKIGASDIWRFAVLGIIGMAGANFLLYYAIGRMNPALADLLQFTAPVMVAVYLAMMGRESMDRPKAFALILSLIGCALALEAFHGGGNIPLMPAAAAMGSAFCYAFLVVFGKGLTARYPTWTFLHYSLMIASLFWICLVSPARTLAQLSDPKLLFITMGFAMTSILIPYTLFFTGLKRVSASRAGIVSTFEPVVIAVGASLFLGEKLGPLQIVGVVLVLVAIVLVELTSKPKPAL
jgi:drug/metabolite transporter, DME family